LKWNLVWLFTMMSYRSILSFVVIDQYLSYGPLDLEKFQWFAVSIHIYRDCTYCYIWYTIYYKNI
jgi:hypothetical protein